MTIGGRNLGLTPSRGRHVFLGHVKAIDRSCGNRFRIHSQKRIDFVKRSGSLVLKDVRDSMEVFGINTYMEISADFIGNLFLENTCPKICP